MASATTAPRAEARASAAPGEGRLIGYLAMPRPAGSIRELDGLRAIAVLLVLLRHGIRPFVREGEPTLPLGPWDAASPLVNGWLGVDLFFVLSGFLITQHILVRLPDRDYGPSLKTYLGKRFLRIVPTYWAWLLIVAFGWLPFYPVLQDFFWIRLSYHLLLLQDLLPSNFVPAFWSLGVEEKFYLLAPLVVLRLRRTASLRTHVGVLGGLLLAPLLFRTLTFLAADGALDYDQFFFRARSPFHASVDVLLFGMIAAFVVRYHRDRPLLADPRAPSVLAVGGAVLCGGLLFGHPLLAHVSLFDATLLGTLTGLGFAAILLGLVLGEVPGTAWLQADWLFFFAKISYSLYLVHMVFVPVLHTWATRVAGPDLGLQLAVFFPVYAAASIATALVLHYCVEKPSLLLKDRLGRAPEPASA